MTRSVLLLLALAGLFGAGCRPLLREALDVREMEPEELECRLAGELPPVVLDVRDAEHRVGGFIPGAVSLAPDEIDGYLAERVPDRDRVVVTVCAGGLSSLPAASRARAAGYRNVFSLAGGMARWTSGGRPVVPRSAGRGPAEDFPPPLCEVGLFTQLVTVITAFGVKPLYMLLSLLVIVWLWGRPEPDLRAIRWAFVAFLFGEVMCAVNYALMLGLCDAVEIAHQVGMVFFGALLPLGLFRMLDGRVIRFTDPKAACSAQRFCRRCWKRENVSCGLHRIMMFLVPAFALVALLPLSGPIRPLNLTTPIFATDVHYRTGALLQLLEFRVYPVAATLLFVVAFLLLRRGRDGPARAEGPFFLGLGFLLFALLRFFLFLAFYPSRPWSDAWEELTELVAVLFTLWLLLQFRTQAGISRPSGEG